MTLHTRISGEAYEGHRPMIALIPSRGRPLERAAWFEELAGVVAIDCLALASEKIAGGATPVQVEAELKQFRETLSVKLQSAVDCYLIGLSEHATPGPGASG